MIHIQESCTGRLQHHGKRHHSSRYDRPLPGKDQLDPMGVQPFTQPATPPQQHQQVVPGDRRRQHHGQGQKSIDHIAPARRPARQPPRHSNATDRRQHSRPAGDLQRQPQRDPNVIHSIRNLKAWRSHSVTAQPARRLTAGTSKSLRPPANGRHVVPERPDKKPGSASRRYPRP